MKTLFYKQMRLACSPVTPFFCLFGLMLLIPNYPYSVSFFYVTLGLFFTFMNMREQKDLYYSALLPIRKADAVRVSVWFAAFWQLLSLVVIGLVSVLAVHLWPQRDNAVGMDPNVMLLGAGFVIYAAFNAVFFTSLFKTGYKVGVSYLKANLAMWPVMVLAEAVVHVPGLDWLDDTTRSANVRQLPILLAGAAIYFAGLWLTCRRAAKSYEKVDL